MKRFTKVLALVLVLAMMVCLCAEFASAKTYKPYKKYVALGDSISAGFGLTDVIGYERVNAAFPAIVADAIGAELEVDAYSAFRTQELRYIIEDDYQGDAELFAAEDVVNSNEAAGLAKHAEMKATMKAKQDIIDADVITLNVGSNDIMTYVLVRVLRGMDGVNGVDKIVDEVESKYFSGDMSYYEAMDKIFDAARTVNKVSKAVNAALDGLYDGYTNFLTNFDIIVNDIYTLNPDVELLVLGMYNPFRDVKLYDKDFLTIGKTLDSFVNLMNIHMKTTCKYASKYTYVDITGTTCYAFTSILDGIWNDNFILNIHPSAAGHQYIAQQILNAFPDASAVPATTTTRVTLLSKLKNLFK